MSAESLNRTIIRAGIVILALLFFSPVYSQDTIKSRPQITIDRPQTIRRPAFDSIGPVNRPILQPQQVTPTEEISSIKEHSPRTALLLSLLPGAGQVYNHQAWKVPIIYAGLGAMGYLVYSNYTEMADLKEDYLFRLSHDGAALIDKYASYPNTSIYNMYQAYNKNFQLMIIISAGVYALNLVDAYVFGHLYDFQINDDLALRISPMVQTSARYWGNGLVAAPSLRFSLTF